MDIFELSHGSEEELIPIKALNDKEAEKVIEHYNLDINDFYYVKGRLYKYCYMRDYVFVEIYNMSIEGFKTYQIIETINFREQYFKRALENKNYGDFFCMLDKPRRLYWFIQLCNEMSKAEARFVFRYIYTSMEYGFKEIPEKMIEEYLYNDDLDRNQFDEIVTIYRGEGSKSNTYDKAYSWTLDRKIAVFFANRFNKNDNNKRLYKAEVKREDIIDCIENRNESEIIVLPKNIMNVKRLM